jgi:hypothetical protein
MVSPYSVPTASASRYSPQAQEQENFMRTKLQIQAPPVYLFHIPKTAGSSLGAVFRPAYAASEIFTRQTVKTFGQFSLANLRNFRCYCCHYGIGLFDLVGRTDLLTITMLRDPIERVVSHYYFHQKWVLRDGMEKHPQYSQEMIAYVQSDIKAWLDIPELAEPFHNEQTRFLGVATDLSHYFKQGTIARRNTQLPTSLLPKPAPLEKVDMAQAAATARQRLEAMTIVGLTERFDESVEMICGMLGIPIPVKTPRANLGPQKKDVDIHRYRRQLAPDLLEQLEALNTYDQELYRCACELFEQQLARFRATPQRTYSIAPRLLMPVRKRIRAAWRKATQDRPAIARHPFVQGAKSWIKRWA